MPQPTFPNIGGTRLPRSGGAKPNEPQRPSRIGRQGKPRRKVGRCTKTTMSSRLLGQRIPRHRVITEVAAAAAAEVAVMNDRRRDEQDLNMLKGQCESAGLTAAEQERIRRNQVETLIIREQLTT
jgi:ABC-type molybdenum transport system ATPase subunit/photorepair protein PhrA